VTSPLSQYGKFERGDRLKVGVVLRELTGVDQPQAVDGELGETLERLLAAAQ
jgi:hypothetical protein